MRFLLVFLHLLPACFAATQIEVHFSMLERVLANQVFTQEGRKYVRGSKTTPCNFAYLEKPHVSSNQGRISIRTRFTGKSALDMFGRCIGLGDSFEADILATPYHNGGKLALKNVEVRSLKADSYYIRKVRQTLAATIERDFSIQLLDAARKILEQPQNGSYKVSLSALEVQAIEIGDNAVKVIVDLRLAVQ